MTRTSESGREIERFIEDYGVLDGWPFGAAQKEHLAKLLTDTYFDACKTLDSAQKVHAAVMRNEERVPKPATIRKWIRQLSHVEADMGEDWGV